MEVHNIYYCKYAISLLSAFEMWEDLKYFLTTIFYYYDRVLQSILILLQVLEQYFLNAWIITDAFTKLWSQFAFKGFQLVTKGKLV